MPFPAIDGLRPSPDSVRERLFNWLRDHVHGATVLDLYAGSGALGFEAASRGAKSVLMVEKNSTIALALEANIERLSAQNTVKVVVANADSYVKRLDGQFDLVFLDPPFHGSELEIICPALYKSGCLRPGTLLYIESHAVRKSLPIPETWHIIRQHTSGQVMSSLIQAA